MNIGPKRIDAAVEEASKAFWAEIEKQFPEFQGEELEPGTVIVLFWQMKDALTRWIQANIRAQEAPEKPMDGKEYQAKVNEAAKKWYKPKVWLGEK